MEWTPELIRELRHYMDIDQGEFASCLGFSRRSTVSELEKGRRSVSERTRTALDMVAKINRFKPQPANETDATDE